jgi:hypothetical protein
MIVTPQENGISEIFCNGDHWMVLHDDSKVLFKGQCGHGITPHTIEYFDTELDMETRIIQLGLEDS